jgi:PP-loop superfamily ATP-utilizing enzyme
LQHALDAQLAGDVAERYARSEFQIVIEIAQARQTEIAKMSQALLALLPQEPWRREHECHACRRSAQELLLQEPEESGDRLAAPAELIAEVGPP